MLMLPFFAAAYAFSITPLAFHAFAFACRFSLYDYMILFRHIDAADAMLLSLISLFSFRFDHVITYYLPCWLLRAITLPFRFILMPHDTTPLLLPRFDVFFFRFRRFLSFSPLFHAAYYFRHFRLLFSRAID